MPEKVMKQSIHNCARCGADHDNLGFKPIYGNPIVDSDGTWNWWSICPATGDPILLRIIEDNEELPSDRVIKQPTKGVIDEPK